MQICVEMVILLPMDDILLLHLFHLQLQYMPVYLSLLAWLKFSLKVLKCHNGYIVVVRLNVLDKNASEALDKKVSVTDVLYS